MVEVVYVYMWIRVYVHIHGSSSIGGYWDRPMDTTMELGIARSMCFHQSFTGEKTMSSSSAAAFTPKVLLTHRYVSQSSRLL